MAEDDPIDAVREAIIFLRMATAQIRHAAARSEPGVAQQLRHIAERCDGEANELFRLFAIGPLQSD